ncbi:MFS transporter [Ruania alkalisoli]|uniref:MFS transporter n=1 Tax=Ruania alkalisoli TaxID=2779775 RepID=A0A7M1SXH7_9MICO|nr:MFS transporter [Ruania alkalisoli]QOR71727.1 MFS transporter [Ruania alkalisoli]
MTSPQAGPAAAAATPAPGPSLWRHRDFRHLWAGDAFGQLGAQLTSIALPVLAVQILTATEWQMGLLSAAGMAAFLLIGLPTGAWVDRMHKRRVLIGADLLRAIVLVVVVLAALTDHASMPLLYAAAFALGGATVFFDVAHQSYIPSLVGMDHVVEGNSKLQATASAARMSGPAIGGNLLRWFTPGTVIGINAVGYLISAVFVWRIKARETLPRREDRRPLAVEIREGLGFVFSERLLIRMVACTALGNLFWGIVAALEALYILRTLGQSEATMGLILSGASIGGLLGAVSGERVITWIGEARIIPVAALGMAVPLPLLPLAAVLPVPPALTLTASLFATMYLMVVYNIATVSFRQRLCPPRLLGRMNASVRFIVWGISPFGGLLGGWLGSAWGTTTALWVPVAGTVLAAMPVVLSPLWRMTELPRAGEPAIDSLETPASPETPA